MGILSPSSGEYYEFDDTEEFIDFVSGQEIIVYAHNGGKFDRHFIIEKISHYEPLTIINGRLAKFKIGWWNFAIATTLFCAPFRLSENEKSIMRFLRKASAKKAGKYGAD